MNKSCKTCKKGEAIAIVRLLFFFSLILHPKIGGVVHGCSIMAPCGITASDIMLTNVTDILHLKLDKYPACDTPHDNPYDILETVVIEFEVQTGILRTVDETPWKAAAEPYHNVLYNATMMDEQLGEWVNYTEGSEIVTVAGGPFDDERLAFELPGFIAPSLQNTMYNYGLETFFSKNLKRIYFIYPIEEGKDIVASCDTDSEVCNLSVPLQEYSAIDRSPDRTAAVYDDSSLQLVGLPVVCCLCINYRYYQYNETTGFRSIDVLNTIYPVAADPRNGVAYAVGYARNEGDDVNIIHQSLQVSSTAGNDSDMITMKVVGSDDDDIVFTSSASFLLNHVTAFGALSLFSSCVILLII